MKQKTMKGAKAVKSQLPAGFKAIRGGGDFADTWNFQKNRTLVGVLTASKNVKLPKRGRIPARTLPVHTIREKSGVEWNVWESAGLRALSRVKKGQRVALIYKGKKKIPGQANPMHDFEVGVA